jgi:GT2 family glycosyltransferase
MITTSVVIPSHQGAKRLEKLLGCLSLQITDFEWEAIVVLDGSTDASEEVVDRWSTTVPVRAIDLVTNQGRPTALNTGFAAAQGQVLIRCDDDLAPDPLFLAHHAEHHRDSDNIGVIGLYDNVLPESPYARAYGEHAHTLFLQTARATPTEFLWRFWAGNCSVSRAMFDRVGPYDTAFRAYGWEDVDWGYRLSLAGATICLDPRLEVPHHVAATTTAIRSRRAYLSGSARTRFNEKHGIVEDSNATGDVKWSPWNTAVRAMSLAPSSIREAGARSIDRVGDHLPIGLTRKLIALCVESSGLAGVRSGPTAPAHLSNGI